MLKRSKSRQGGFSLIELLVAMVIGLVVTGAVVAFIYSMMQANTQTLSATRLNAELRTSAELVSREVRRAAYVMDPIAGIGTGCTATTGANQCPYVAVRDVSINTDGNCLRFAYQVPSGSGGAMRFQAIRIADGRLQMGVGTAAVTCDQATTPVSSQLVNLTSNGSFTLSGRGIEVLMQGTLTGSNENPKQYLSVVAVRSGA